MCNEVLMMFLVFLRASSIYIQKSFLDSFYFYRYDDSTKVHYASELTWCSEIDAIYQSHDFKLKSMEVGIGHGIWDDDKISYLSRELKIYTFSLSG